MCGIAGIINKFPRKFDYATFCTLGVSNDVRGGDSCGIFIDGRYGYGVKENKFFSNYFQENEIIDNTKTSTIALVHCRKASVGAVNEQNAQPVVITDKDGKVEFVVLHNGTIYNYKELAKKYIPKVDITDMTDSQVMARIFYYSGYDVLNEYNGGAVFVIVDYREGAPRTLFFKGASKKNSYSKEQEEERPLYFCIDKDNKELVFSSIWEYIMTLRRDFVTYSFRPNILMEFNGTSFNVIGRYSRDKVYQLKETIYSYPKYSMYGNDDDDWYDQFDSYLSVNMINNTYSFKGKKIDGKLYISDYGKVFKKGSQGYEVWFFNGVALKNEHCYRFLSSLKKETKLSDDEFFKKFENVIRFLSVDRVYPRGEFWYEATSPVNYSLYTGIWTPMTTVTSHRYGGGVKIGTSYVGIKDSVKSKVSIKVDMNFKTIKEECKSLMK